MGATSAGWPARPIGRLLGAEVVDLLLGHRGGDERGPDGAGRDGVHADPVLDRQHERPHWGSIATGLFGTRETLAPLTEAQLTGDQLQLPFAGDHVKDAPEVEPYVQLSAEEEQQPYRALELSYDRSVESDDAMIRSEEEITLRKQQRPRERIRLKKYVVTDYVKKTVPVQREKVRLEHEPAEADRADQ